MSENKGRGRRPSKLERLEIRRELFSNVVKGTSITDACENIIKDYKKRGIHVTFNSLYRDWNRRTKWLPLLVKLEDEQELVTGLMLELRESRIEAWTLYNQTMKNNNENAAVGILKVINDSIYNQVKLLQSLGKMHRAPTSIEGVESGSPIILKMWRPPGIPPNGLRSNLDANQPSAI